MGRAIDMEKCLSKLSKRVDTIENALSKIIDVVDAMEEKGQQVQHVDLIDDVKPDVVEEKITEEKPKSKKSGETAKRLKKD